MMRAGFFAVCARAARLLDVIEAEHLHLYDFRCDESEKHTCACQVQCEDRRRCKRALALCGRLPVCEYVVMNPSGDWGTLKREANEIERRELLGYEEKDMTPAAYEQRRATFEKEGSRWRAKYLARGGFARMLDTNRSLTLASTLKDSPLCGGPADDAARWLAQAPPSELTIGLVALSYKTPATLRRSMRSWLESGLLHAVDERIAIVNDPTPAERAICVRHGFDVRTPSDLVGPRNGTVPLLRTVKRDVFTIGAAFAAALVESQCAYVLFLEKDFAMDPNIKIGPLLDELALSVTMLRRGAAVVRLRSVLDQGCGTFRRCQDNANMPDWAAANAFHRRRNWWSFYCKDFVKPDAVADCAVGLPDSDTRRLRFRCFTSWDSNWSLNAIMIDRMRALTSKWQLPSPRRTGRQGHRSRFAPPGTTLAAFAASTWNKQDGFEVGMLKDDWGRVKMPLCLSTRGLFRHVEVDG